MAYGDGFVKRKKRDFRQGLYKLINEDRYIGNKDNIIYRSSWEHSFLQFLDSNKNVKYFSSEELFIPYTCPHSGKIRRYFPDFFVEFIDGKKFIIEIKPYIQTQIPVRPKKARHKPYQEALATYLTNQRKWEAARNWCSKNNMFFEIFTEHELNKLAISTKF